uniref:Uncharacterized protein n=1 Tax=Vannella robusta TaxID=1487602 RepID=A0A7S4MR89_9EUKA|mmetsp:Transcript_72/g.99  ORF Transcript_72/g.99 Transcript_72/m.99 type:complete len:137 (+) Transcript_72:2-412(+)
MPSLFLLSMETKAAQLSDAPLFYGPLPQTYESILAEQQKQPKPIISLPNIYAFLSKNFGFQELQEMEGDAYSTEHKKSEGMPSLASSGDYRAPINPIKTNIGHASNPKGVVLPRLTNLLQDIPGCSPQQDKQNTKH